MAGGDRATRVPAFTEVDPGRTFTEELRAELGYPTATMNFANHVKIERMPDHFFIRFGLRQSRDDKDEGVEVAVIAVPLELSVDLSLKLFEALFKSVPELQNIFNSFQVRVSGLNALTEAQKKAKAGATGQ